MTSGQWVLLASVLLAVGFGLYRAWADGRFTGTHAVTGADDVPDDDLAPDSAADRLAAGGIDVALGERATLVQFSSAFCAPCRTTRVVLGDIATRTPGVTHVEIDAEHHLDVVRRLGVLRTPTTLVLDAAGHEVVRAAGAPRREQVVAALPVVSE